MTDRSVRVRLEANVVGFVAQMEGKAVGAINKVEAAAVAAGKKVDAIGDGAVGIGRKIDTGVGRGVTSLDKLAAAAHKNEQALNTLGRGASTIGLVAAAGLGAAAKAAIDWESAWAGVTKTVDGTASEMAELEGQLRGMAKTLPATHQEIAAVAEAAGQLGVRRQDIAAFTKVMVDLGESTNLTSDEAATSLARFMNVMQTAPQNVGRLGAAIVALGNDGASTERDIVAMAQRISGSGRIIGLSETQVLAYASALANVGIEAEAGGSAISTIFTKIDKAVSEGGDGLANFARVSGLTASQFKQQFETDASGATQAFIEGIGRMNDAGMDVNGTLETLGITEIRQRDAVLRLAASGTNLADSLKVSADGWRENTALVDEAAARYATTESQIRIAWNNIKDAAITAGGAMLPIIADIAKQVADLAKWFADLPAPVRNSAVALGAVVAVIGLVGGATLKMITALAEARTAMTALGLSSTRASAALATIGKASIALGLAAIAAEIKNMAEITKEMDLGGLTGDVLRFGETGKSTGQLLKNFGNDFSGVSAKFRADGDSLSTMLATVGRESSSGFEAFEAWIDGGSEASKRVHEIDEALAALVEGGNAESAAKAFERLELMAREQNVSLATLQKIFPEYGSAVEAAGLDAQIAGQKAATGATGNKALATSLDETKKAAQEAEQAIDDYVKSLFNMPNLALSVRDSQRGVQAAIDDATASIKENGKTLDIGTEKGRANQAALDAIATSAQKLSEAYLRNDSSQKTITASAVAAQKSFVDLAVKMGYSKTQAQALAEQLIKIPDKKDIKVSNNAGPEQKPAKDAKSYAAILAGTLPAVNTIITNNGAGTPKTAAERYNEVLRGTLPKVNTVVTNNAPVAKEKIDGYRTALGLLPPGKSTKVSTPGATVSQGQVGGLLSLLSQMPASKTTKVTVNTYKNLIETTTHRDVGVRVGPPQADGGYWPHGVPSYANGKLPSQAMVAPGQGRGLVQWAEGETGGEAFIPLAPSKRDRSTAILNKVADQFGYSLVRSFASGGFLPGGRLVDIAMLLKQLGLPFNPLSGINYQGTLAAMNKANAAVTPAKARAVSADRTERAAKLDLTHARQAVAAQEQYLKKLRDEGASSAKLKAERADLLKLQQRVIAAKQREATATKASAAADAAYKTKVEAAKKATEAHRESIEKLVEQQKAAAEMAKQVSDSLLQGANIGDLFAQSFTGKGLLADLQGKEADLSKFRATIDSLRKKGLSEVLIEQLIGKGADQGGEAAQGILEGGSALIAALNKAQAALQQQADLIGAGAANAQYGVQVTGKKALGGSVNPRSDYLVGEDGPEILRMGSRGGWIYPNRYVGNGGSTFTKVTEVHQHMTFYGVSMAEADLIASRANAKAELAARGY